MQGISSPRGGAPPWSNSCNRRGRSMRPALRRRVQTDGARGSGSLHGLLVYWGHRWSPLLACPSSSCDEPVSCGVRGRGLRCATCGVAETIGARRPVRTPCEAETIRVGARGIRGARPKQSARRPARSAPFAAETFTLVAPHFLRRAPRKARLRSLRSASFFCPSHVACIFLWAAFPDPCNLLLVPLYKKGGGDWLV